jgi:hypothetical protein
MAAPMHDLQLVRTKAQRAVHRARELHDSASRLHLLTRRRLEYAEAVRATATATCQNLVRGRCAAPEIGSFRVEGQLDGNPSWALWDGTTLVVDDELVRVARIVVDLGEQFVHPADESIVVPASLDEPGLAMMLTFMRALTTITNVELGVPGTSRTGPVR